MRVRSTDLICFSACGNLWGEVEIVPLRSMKLGTKLQYVILKLNTPYGNR